MIEPSPLRIFRPNSIPQERFLSTPADIAVYGGSAGGGKTVALLLEAIRHIANPEYGAVIFRRTSPQITNQGGLWDEAEKIYPGLGGIARKGNLDYTWSHGAKVSFKHLQHEKNKLDWQGSQIPMIGFDELTHYSESQFFYFLSRNRSTCGVRPYIRGTTNPDASSWVKKFLAPWVDRKFPDPAVSGEIRWFVRINGEIVWARSPQALVDRFGPEAEPKSVTFVRASVYDNVDLLRLDPGYLANLKALPPVEQARLLLGDWDVCNEGLVYPDFGRCVVEAENWPKNMGAWNYGGIDWGWNNPFGALGACLDSDDVLWVGWERHGSRITLTDHSKALPRGSIRWFADPAGADQIAEVRTAGHDVVPCVHLGQQPLANGLGLVSDRIRSGRLKVHGNLGNLIDESGKYRYETETKKQGETEKPIDKDNHLLAALRYMIVGIDRMRSVKDRDPGPTAEDIAASEEAARLAEERREEEWNRIDNPHWWGNEDD